MKKPLLLWTLLSCTAGLWGQNLVLNPGFEDLSTEKYLRDCAFSDKTYQFNETVQHWHSFQMLTPDMISQPDSADCVFQSPYRGKRMLGFINYYPSAYSGWRADYHEFVHGSLRQPLKKGQTYELSFWIKRLVEAPLLHLKELGVNQVRIAPVAVASSNLGVRFFKEPASPEEYFGRSVRQFNIRPHVNVDTIIARQARQWVRLRVEFTAPTNARYFVLGNFYDDQKAQSTYQISEFEVTPPQITYYCIDEVYIGPVQDGLEASLEQTGQYTFRSVHFPSASAELQAEALPELDELAAYLQKHPKKKAEIAGHTDDVGQATDNQQLSEARAKAVRAYLVSRGVAADRLAYRGYGEQQPFASNADAAGRRQNRRVECVLK